MISNNYFDNGPAPGIYNCILTYNMYKTNLYSQ